MGAPESTPGISWTIPRGRLRWLPESTPSLSEYSLVFNNYNYMRPSQNLLMSPRIYPPPLQQLYATPPESTPPSPKNILLISQDIPPPLFNNYNRPFYATLPESTPHSQNIPLLNQLICANLPESTPPSKSIPSFSATICDPPRIYPSQDLSPFSTTICDPPRIYPSLPDYTPLFQLIYMCDSPIIYPPPSHNIGLPPPPHLFNNYMRPSQNLHLPLRL